PCPAHDPGTRVYARQQQEARHDRPEAEQVPRVPEREFRGGTADARDRRAVLDERGGQGATPLRSGESQRQSHHHHGLTQRRSRLTAVAVARNSSFFPTTSGNPPASAAQATRAR